MNQMQRPPDSTNLFERLEQLNQIGVALSKETDINRLLEAILVAAQKITHADGGTLYRMTDPAVLQKLTAPTGRLMQLVKNRTLGDDALFDELFLATLSRLPTAAEKAAFVKYKDSESNRAALFQDTLWALINTREFILNH